MTGKNIQLNLKKNGTIILIMNLLDGNKDFTFITMALLLTLLALITCTCNGQRSILEHQILEKQTDSSLYFGKHVKQIQDVMECATLKTDDLDFLLCHQQSLSTKLQYLPMLGLEYFQVWSRCQKNVYR